MYKLRDTKADPQRFTNTSMGVKGRLTLIQEFIYDATARTWQVIGLQLNEGKESFVHTQVEEGDIDWLPNIRPGYYNVMGRPWAGYWVEQTAARQYHAGLNERNIRAFSSWTLRPKRPMYPGFKALSTIYEGRDEYHPVDRALSMIKRRKVENSQVALSRNLAIERGVHDIGYLVYRARRIVGLVQDGHLLVDETFNHPDLHNLEHTHETVKKLRGILQQAPQA